MKVNILRNLRKHIVFAIVFTFIASFMQVVQPQIFTPTAAAAEVDTSTEGFVFDISLAPSTGSGTNWRIYLSPTETGTATIDWPTSSDSSVSLVGGTVSNITVAEVDRIVGVLFVPYVWLNV